MNPNEMPNELIPENPKFFICEICHYKTESKKDFRKHLATRKHEILSNPNFKNPKIPPKHFTCECKKIYKHQSSLCAHKKDCKKIKDNIEEEYVEDNNSSDTDIIPYTTPNENIIISSACPTNDIQQLTSLVIEVVKNNSDFQKQMMEMCKSMQSTIISNNCNNTTNNNTFNLQVFLNEHCKDAMNISEFIDSFDLQVSDLENVGRVGYIEGMSSIIINKIKELDVNKRPIHCSDLKREIIYIKDDDVWEREDANNSKFRKVIKKVAGKNIGMLNDWRDMYPECMDVESEYNDVFVKLTRTAMGPSDTEGTEAKIMKKIIKHIVIDKKALTQ